MTETTRNALTEAGWYADPSGAPRQRWWDGERWTEHMPGPSMEKYGATHRPVVGPEVPVYGASIWLIVGLPLFSVFAMVSFDMTRYLIGSTSGLAPFDLSYLFLQGLGFATYVASVAFAFADWRRLGVDGFERPFHWAWAFLSTALYVIGRSVVVYRRAGRGLWPIGALVGLMVLGVIVVVVKVTEALPVLMMSAAGS